MWDQNWDQNSSFSPFLQFPALYHRSSVPLSSSQAPPNFPKTQVSKNPWNQFWPKLSLTPPLPTSMQSKLKLFLGRWCLCPSPTSHGLLWDAITHICSSQPCQPILKAKET